MQNGRSLYYKARRAPSVGMIENRLCVSRGTAEEIKAVLSGKRDLLSYPPLCLYHSLSYGYCGDGEAIALLAINIILDGLGVECLYESDGTAGVEYVNQGETYQTTILYDWERDLWICASWGGLVEQFPNRFAA